MLWIRLQQEKRKEQLEALEKAIVAKEATWQRLNGGQGKISEIKARFDQELKQLQDQRDELQAERSQLIRVSQCRPCHQFMCMHRCLACLTEEIELKRSIYTCALDLQQKSVC